MAITPCSDWAWDPRQFARAFGSLVTAHDLAGLPNGRQHSFVGTKRALLKLGKGLFSDVCAFASRYGASVEIATSPFTLIVNGDIAVRVDVVPNRPLIRGAPNWKVALRAGADFVVAARHDPTSGELPDYFLLPASEFAGYPIYIKVANLSQFDRMRHISLHTMNFVDPAASVR